MRSKKKLTELEKEKLLDQEEMIDFYYNDKESKTKILVHDKRKIKVALMELDEEERKRRNEILENECPYNQRTDDPMDDELEEQYEELGYEQTELEETLEDILQEMVDKIADQKENTQKIKEIIEKNLENLTKQQLITIFLYYYIELSEQKIADYFGVTRQRIHTLINRINKKLLKNETK